MKDGITDISQRYFQYYENTFENTVQQVLCVCYSRKYKNVANGSFKS